MKKKGRPMGDTKFFSPSRMKALKREADEQFVQNAKNARRTPSASFGQYDGQDIRGVRPKVCRIHAAARRA